MTLQYLDTVIAFVVILLGASLLITILIQMVSALLSYRGTNLLWGLQTLLSTIDPGLANQAKQLATKVLTQPIISDSILSKFTDNTLLGKLTTRWRLASAISPEVLAHGLRNISETIRPDDAQTATSIDNLLGAVDPEAARKAQMVETVFTNLTPNYAIQVDKIVQQLSSSVQESVGKLEAGFNIAMKRAAQRFAFQVRIWTVVFAVLVAFGAHLDSLRILRQLWTSPELRASLVGQREALLKEASVIIPTQGGVAQGSGPSVAPEILVEAMKKVVEKEKEATTGLGAIPLFTSLDEAVAWLKAGLTVDETRKAALVAEYKKLVLAELKDQANHINQELAKGGFQLIPTPYPGLHYDGLSNILGILITAGFLSLGAPFWFNALKTLSNLRPLVATRQEGQKRD
jgi:hypothetical protein